MPPALKPILVARLLELVREGIPAADIATKLAIHQRTVEHYAKLYGYDQGMHNTRASRAAALRDEAAQHALWRCHCGALARGHQCMNHHPAPWAEEAA